MYTLKVFNNISDKGLSRLPSDQYQINDTNPDAILLRSHQLSLSDIDESVQAIGRAGAGVNNIPVTNLSEQGIPVFNTPGANANAVKELVLAGLLLAARNICPAWEFANNTGDMADDSFNKTIESGKKQFKGIELPGRTLGVIGLGAIGVKVANDALKLGMRVIGFDPNITVGRAWSLSAQVQQAENLSELLKASEFVTVHVPLNQHTEHLIDDEKFAMMKDNHVLLNFSRGGIVDEQALLRALASNKCAKYVCDFPSKRFSDQKNIISLPHLGASTQEAEENCAVMIVNQIQDFLETGQIKNSVNFPEVNLPRTGGPRLTIANVNVPNMVAQISSTLAKAGLNIVDMLNKSRNELAYTIIDVDKPIPDTVVSELMAVEGILRIRSLP